MEHIYTSFSGDLLGIIILLFLMRLIPGNKFVKQERTRNYFVVACMTIVIILLEIASNLLDTYASSGLRIYAQIVNLLGFSIMFMLPIAMAMLYSEKVYRYHFIFAIPSVVGIIICICSVWTGWIFNINLDGTYERGEFFLINSLVVVYGLIVLFYAHVEMGKEYDYEEKVYLWILYAIVCGTGIVQVVHPKIHIMWGGIAVAEMFYFVFLQELQFKYDSVTGMRNRSNFEQQLCKSSSHSNIFLVAFDLNNLKYVNDTYGHKMGDQYLKESAEIIKAAYEDCGNTFRIGGDEFVVIARDCMETQIKEAKEHMMDLVRAHKFPFEIEYYIANAYCHYDESCHGSLQNCLKEADSKMYEDKRMSKNSGKLEE